jgi:hypothetical protein
MNEVTLLLAEGRAEEASARAGFWAAKLTRERYPDPEVIESLRAMQRDPASAMARLVAGSRGADLDALAQWVNQALQRPLPVYAPQALPVIDAGDPQAALAAARQLVEEMRVPPEEAEKVAKQLARDIARSGKRMQRQQEEARAKERQGALFEEPAVQDDARVRDLRPAQPQKSLEQAWRVVFPCDKPMLTARMPEDAARAWEDGYPGEWLGFLERRPEAADSLDVLDDVVGALLELERQMPQGAGEGLAARLNARACAIVRAGAERQPDAVLPWAGLPNRPALRALVREMDLCLQRGDDARAAEVCEEVLRLNPDDHHGLRAILVTLLLQRGDDGAAAALLARFPEDDMLAMRCGGALLAFRRGDLAVATAALQEVVTRNRFVIDYLTRDKARAPRMGDYGLSCGGRDEAWAYREEARAAWQAAPGALEWLRRTQRALKAQGKAKRAPGKAGRSAP